MFSPTAILTSSDCESRELDGARPVRGELTAQALTAEEPRLRRLVHRLLGWPKAASDVDDVVQETLLAAWTHRGRFRGEASAMTWLHRIAVRKSQNHVRAARVRQRLFGWLLREPTAAEPPTDERHARTRRALQVLPHQDREVLVLRYLEQRGIDEVTTLLGCSRAAVDARLSRARKRLRAAVDREGEA